MAEPVAPSMVYLDYAATAPVEESVARRMADVLQQQLGNPASAHAAGQAARQVVETARAQVAALVGADPACVVFTSGATESNNLAISGTVRAALLRGEKPHLITLATEHKSVLEPVRAAAVEGAVVTILKPDAQGVLDAAVLAAAMRPNTCLVSLLHVNNETGVAQDLAALRAVCAAHGVPLHVDAAQSAGKLPVDVEGVALLSFTAHKLGGPQGIGALYVSPAHRLRLRAQMLGGGHERGLRAGTLATHQIAGFGIAAETAARRREREFARLTALRQRLWRGLSVLPGTLLNGHAEARVPGILNVTFAGVEGESLFTGLRELCLSTGSACNSRNGEPSYVLRALGRDTEQAQSSLRFSLGAGSTEADVDAAIAAVWREHARLWALSPARGAPFEGPHGEAGEERLGTWVRFTVKARAGAVQDARAQVYGCPHTIAVCSYLEPLLRGQRLDALQMGSPDQWRTMVDGPVEKLGRMLIIEDALRALCLQGTGN